MTLPDKSPTIAPGLNNSIEITTDCICTRYLTLLVGYDMTLVGDYYFTLDFYSQSGGLYNFSYDWLNHIKSSFIVTITDPCKLTYPLFSA